MKLPFARYVKRHHITRTALTAGALAAVIVFFVVGAALRLLVGPVSLGPLRGTLAEAIRVALPGINLDYDQAAIEWSRDRGRVNLVVLGARIADSRGHIVAQAPKADIDLAAAPFLAGRFVVQRITLVGVQLSLVHLKEGGIRLGAERDRNGDDIISRLRAVIESRSGGGTALGSFAVRDARLALYDESTGLFVVAPRAALTVRGRTGAISAVFDADVEISGRKGHVVSNLLVPDDKGPVTGDATVTGLDLSGLGANAAIFAPFKKFPLITDLSARFSAEDGHLLSADFDGLAHGTVPLLGKPLHVRGLRVTGRYDGARHRLVLDRAELDAAEARGRLTGAGQFFYDGAGKLDHVHGEVAGSHILVALPGLYAAPAAFNTLNAAADYHPATGVIDIAHSTVTANGFALDTEGRLTLVEGKSPGLALKGRLAALPVKTLIHYWPLPAAPGAREWIAADIFSGIAGPFQFETNFAPGELDLAELPDASLKLAFSMRGVEGAYIDGLTHLTQVAGSALLTGDNFTAIFTGGRVGNIVLTGGKAVIPDLHLAGTAGIFTAHADGAMPDIMALIDMKPLRYPTRFGIDPATTEGQASVDLNIRVPMLRDLPVEKVGILVKAQVNGFGVTLGKTRLNNGNVNFTIDNKSLHQVGTVQLADSRLTVDWMEQFETPSPVTTRVNVRGTLGEGARAALNIGLTKILTGPVGVSGLLEGNRGSLRTADVTLDLTPATIAIPILNLGKSAGAVAGGRVTVNFAPGDIVHDQTIRLTGPNLSATGTANFDAKGELTLLNFANVKMGALNDLSVTLARGPNGDDYTLRGRSLDGSMIGRNGTTPEKENAGGAAAKDDSMNGPFHISARLDRFAMRDDVSIAPFNLDLSGVGERPATLSLSGQLSKNAAITGGIEVTPQGRKLSVTAMDAGLLLRGLFAFESMKGGKLSLAATLPGRATDPDVETATPDYTGNLTIENFTMVNQPLLTRLFSAGSLTGIGDLMGGDGVSLERLDVPFSSKNNVISVHDARARGRAIGATADGYIDRPKNQVALKGSLVPAFGLNSVLGNIPLLGDVLVSKKGEGIFGITYSATGNADQPNISTNPLSMLTPGILRRIFEGNMPNAANAPSNAPKPN